MPKPNAGQQGPLDNSPARSKRKRLRHLLRPREDKSATALKPKAKKKSPAVTPEARTPAEAWKHLVKIGGLEPEGRDENLIDLLREKLQPTAMSLDDALSRVGMAHFLNSFFECVAPYAAMLKSLLEYFEAADAKHGPGKLRITLKDVEAGELNATLAHFRELAQKWRQSVQAVDVHVPNPLDPWALIQALGYDRQSALSPDAQEWITAYENGVWMDLPKPPEAPPGREEVVENLLNVAQAVLHRMRTYAPNRKALLSIFHKERSEAERKEAGIDFFSYPSLAKIESDYWLAQLVGGVFQACERADLDKAASALFQRVAEILKTLPKRQLTAQVRVQELEDFLSLPMWKFRHALFSSWVHTEMIHAIGIDHFDLFTDGGVLKFGFGAFKLARLKDRFQPLDFMSERRTPGTGLVGKSRKGNIQPDYSVWPNGTITADSCVLAVECKQYKDQSKANFRDALIDYSKTLNRAKVILAAYGPASQSILDEVHEDLRDRCLIIERLEPTNASKIKEFRDAVRDALLPPAIQGNAALRPKAAVVVDVSGSMADNLRDPTTVDRVMELAARVGASHVIAADTEVRGCVEATPEKIAVMLSYLGYGLSTDLHAALKTVLCPPGKMAVLIDEDGYGTLGDLLDQFAHVDLMG